MSPRELTAAAVERARLAIQAAEPRPAARARILREYHAAGRHDARPVADCRDCLTFHVSR